MQALVLSLFLMQSNINVNPQSWADQQKLLWEVKKQQMQSPFANPRIAAELRAKQQAEVENYFFAQKFNKLVAKLKEFAEDYNTGSVNAKKVKAVQKAWDDLQKTEGWFKSIPKDNNLLDTSGGLQATAASSR